MNADVLIKKAADDFKRILQYDYKPNYHLDVKSKLESILYNYDEPVDKLIFLYQTINNIDELLDKHNEKCTHKADPENCVENVHYGQLKFFTEQEIRRLNPSYEYSILRPNINSNLIKQNLVNLEAYPKAAKVYLAAIDKINQSSYQRNLLDDLRLTLEILLKEFLQNDKPLEKQNNDIGRYLKDKNVSIEVSNMFVALKDYFTKYQNDYVKHDDNVNKQEIELMINLTSTFINFLINI
jgi:hypothetical protein